MGLISQEKRAHAHAHCPATLTGTTHWQEKHGRDDKKNGVRIWSVGKKPLPLHPHKAQMAESVDALVSNTSGETRPGSTPGLGTK